MDKDVFLFFCSTVAQSVAGMLAFFGAFAMFRIAEVERILAERSAHVLPRLETSLGATQEEAKEAMEHLVSGRFRDFTALVETVHDRLPKGGAVDFETEAGIRALSSAKRRREFIFSRGQEILLVGMLSVLAALAAMGGFPANLVEPLGLAVCAGLLLATAWTLLRGIAIVLGRLPDA